MRGGRLEHPAVVRQCHWIAALAIAMLVASGLEIFAAFPSFGEKIPQQDLFTPPQAMRLGGWLGGALQWHLAFAWIFIGAGLTYVMYQAASGNYRQLMFGRSGIYNPLQKLAYTIVLALGAVLVVTGLALYKPVQLSFLVTMLGGFRLTRVWHFAAMVGLLTFIPGHLVMVAIHGWANFASMWTGSKSCPDAPHCKQP
jgi:thiosulfate reductase cytochrome b subunit